MAKKFSIVFTLLFFCTLSSQAQFKKLIHKAKEKIEHALTKEDSSQTQQNKTPTEKPAETPKAAEEKQENEAHNPPPPKPIDFPHTGHTVKAMHAVFKPVIDGDLKKILDTPQGQYAITLARKKGFTGNDKEILRQMLDLKNYEKMQEIDQEVEKKFGKGRAKKPSSDASNKMNNPAWNGFSAPSLYFDVMIGRFDIWMTDHYIKTASKHDHTTMADAFGVNVVSITDVEHQKNYSVASVLGVQYSKVRSLDSLRSKNEKGLYGAAMILPIVKQRFLGVKGVKVKPGTSGMFGKYHTVSEKLVIPVQPVKDPTTGKPDNNLLAFHDILSDRDDALANDGKGNWDPSFKIIYEYYFTHDFDKYLPEGIKNMESTEVMSKGLCVGAAIKDENGNSAVFRITDVQTDQDIDSGQFQVPKDYPVMTDKELHKAIRKKMLNGAKRSMIKGLKEEVMGNHQ